MNLTPRLENTDRRQNSSLHIVKEGGKSKSPREFKLDAKTSKRLFGNLSINEMALFKRGNPDDYVKNYEINPE